MKEIKVDDVAKYIDTNVLHSEQWDQATDKKKQKAMNAAIKKLELILRPELAQGYQLTVDDIALQAVWMLKVDDTFQRAEMGVTYMAIDGVMIMMNGKDNTLAPDIATKFGLSLSHGVRRKAGSYVVGHSTNYRIPVNNSKKTAQERLWN